MCDRVVMALRIALLLCVVLLMHEAALCSSTTAGSWFPPMEDHPTSHSRSLLQAAAQSTNTSAPSLILAQDRTERPDLLNGFKIYRGGWDIRDQHYWASVGFTGGPGFVVAAVWLACGLLLLPLCCCCVCCCSSRTKWKGSHQGGGKLVALLLLVLFTCIAVTGCVLVYIGQGRSHAELSETLSYVVDESDLAVSQLQNVSTVLTDAQSINVITFGISNSEKLQLQQLNGQLTSASKSLKTKTHENADNISAALNYVRLAMIIVAGVMLLLVLLGFVLSTLGIAPLMYLLVFVGWFLVTGTWILCGVYIMLNNVVGDTCFSMEEWVANPTAKTSLEEILPCVDVSTTNEALEHTRKLTNETVVGINNVISTRLNNGSSHQGLPLMCNPVEQDLDLDGCVNLTHASEEWEPFVCTSSDTMDSSTCPLGGRLTTQVYNQLNQSVAIIDELNSSIVFLLDLANCRFVRAVFTVIQQDHCHSLREYTKWQYVGLALTSGGTMFSIVMWIIFNKRRRQDRFLHPQYVEEQSSGQINFRGPPEMLPK